MLLDTDVLIDHLRGIDAASVLTRFELLAGMRSDERHVVRALVDAFPNRPTTPDIATQAGIWAREYRRSHGDIGPVDFLIAATAAMRGVSLLTRNVRHLSLIHISEPTR